MTAAIVIMGDRWRIQARAGIAKRRETVCAIAGPQAAAYPGHHPAAVRAKRFSKVPFEPFEAPAEWVTGASKDRRGPAAGPDGPGTARRVYPLARAGSKIERVPLDALDSRSFAMQDHSPRLSLPFILPSQAQKHVTHNEALTRIDITAQLALEGTGANTPPALPEAGQVWALGPAPTGDWAGQADTLAAFVNESWLFVTPGEGWIALDKSDGRLYRRGASGWVPLAPPVLDNLDGVGINASHDSTNRLAVSSPATLLNHEGAGHQLKINKAEAGDTASLLFQTGFGGRAEMGTSGNDDFAVKVSADGAAWVTAFSFDATTGHATGAAIQQGATDATPGRLLVTGAFGWGQTGAGGVPVLADLDDPAQPAGSYAVDGTTAGPRPAGASTGLCLSMRSAPDDLAQVFIGTDGAVVAVRTRAGGAWGAWQAVQGDHNVTRTTTADGEALRYPDGTQICRHTLTLAAPDTGLGALFAGAAETAWGYPAPFAPGTRPTLSASATAAASLWVATRAGDETTGHLRAMAAVSAASAPEVTVTAIGRWA